MAECEPTGGIYKVSENAYFVVDFKESVLIPKGQGDSIIFYGWTSGPGAPGDCQNEDSDLISPDQATQLLFG